MLPKPRKGTAAKAKRARRRRVETQESAAKLAAKQRDGWICRRCGSDRERSQRLIIWSSGVEAAHLIDKGMGGDHGRHSNEAKHYVTLCHACHQGPRSVHSGHVRMVFDPVKMGDGRVSFVERDA